LAVVLGTGLFFITPSIVYRLTSLNQTGRPA
jgi:hypothetical protein